VLGGEGGRGDDSVATAGALCQKGPLCELSASLRSPDLHDFSMIPFCRSSAGWCRERLSRSDSNGRRDELVGHPPDLDRRAACALSTALPDRALLPASSLAVNFLHLRPTHSEGATFGDVATIWSILGEDCPNGRYEFVKQSKIGRFTVKKPNEPRDEIL